MTDSDDKLRRRYREIATEEPSAVIDAAILARARAARPRRNRWMGPVSIAAVLVLGIGVSLRMQLDQPGIETSDPLREASPPSEYSLPPAEEPPAPPPATATDAAKLSTPSKPAAAQPLPPPKPAAAKPLADAPRPQPGAAAFTPSPPPVQPTRPAAPPASAASPPPAAERQRLAAPPASPPPAANALPQAPAAARVPQPAARSEEAAAVGRVQEAPAAGTAAPPSAKREDAQLDALGVRELRKSVAADSDPARELERIAKLREVGQHADADIALAEFRKRHPDYRIPEAMLERVKAR